MTKGSYMSDFRFLQQCVSILRYPGTWCRAIL